MGSTCYAYCTLLHNTSHRNDTYRVTKTHSTCTEINDFGIKEHATVANLLPVSNTSLKVEKIKAEITAVKNITKTTSQVFKQIAFFLQRNHIVQFLIQTCIQAKNSLLGLKTASDKTFCN
jgi:hypothetical protein